MKSEGVSHTTFYIRFTKSLEIIELCLTLYSNIEHMIFEELKTKMCPYPAGNYMFKVNNGNTRTLQRQWRRSGVFIVNFEHISHLVQVFLLLTLSR